MSQSGGRANVVVKFDDGDLIEEVWGLDSYDSDITELPRRAATIVFRDATTDYISSLSSASRFVARLLLGNDQYINAIWEDLSGFEDAFRRLTEKCGLELLAPPTPTPIAVPTALPTQIPTPTPIPIPVWDAIDAELRDTSKTWRKEHLFRLLLQLIKSPSLAGQYADRIVTIQGEYSYRSQNVLRLSWKYGEPIDRNFSVTCTVEAKDIDVNQLAKLDSLQSKSSLITVQGLLKGVDAEWDSYSQPIRVRDSGLSLSMTLNDCRVTHITE